MRTAQLVLSHYAILAIFVCTSFILGRRLLRRLAFNSAWEAAGFAITLGTGIIAYLVFFLGLAGELYPWLLGLCLAVLAGVAVLTAPDLFCLSRASVSAWRRLPRRLLAGTDSLAMLGCLGVAGAAGSLLPLYPPIAWDSIEYHMAVAKIYIQSHALVFTKFLRYPVIPQLNQMLFTLMLAFSDDLSAQLIQYLFFLLVAILLYAYARRYFSGWAGILAAILWLSSANALWAGRVAYIDMGLVLFGLAGVLAFLNYTHTRQTPWLALAGALLGCAAAVKYPALFWVALCGLYTLWLGFRERSWRIPVLFGLVFILVACPFYIRDFYYTGNPFFPYLSSFFPEGIWNKQDFASLALEQNLYGLPKTLASLIKLPWFLMTQPQQFQSNMPAFDAYYLAFLPISLAAGAILPRLRVILRLALAYTLFWFFTPQVLRYLLPAFPLFCLLSGVAFETILAALLALLQKKVIRPIPGWLAPLLFGLVIVPIMLQTCKPTINFYGSQGLPPTTPAKRDAYLEKWLPNSSYPAYQLLNAARGKNYRLYALFDEDMAYFADGVFMGDWFGPARFAPVLDALADGQKLYDQLRMLDAQYFLFQGNRAGSYKLPDDPVFHQKFRKIYDENNVQLFELAAP
jgi:4-amino-4-deoxy-L-arabinose transferase-like glycosyltransferase